jgi:hypothetical protein
VAEPVLTWQLALKRLLRAPMLSGPQARYLLEGVGGPRGDVLQWLFNLLSSGKPASTDAAFLLRSTLLAEDKPWVLQVLSGQTPPAARAWLRALYQHGVLSGRLGDEQAEIPLSTAEQALFHIEDVVREIGDLPSPWQRARVAAESLVGDAAVADGETQRVVHEMAARLCATPDAIWSELLIHPLTRPAIRSLSQSALQAPSHAAATHLELAQRALLPGELHDLAVAEASRHRREAGPPPWHARVGGADGQGAFPVLFWVDGPVPEAVAAVVGPGASQTVVQAGATHDTAERALAFVDQGAARGSRMREVPPAVALGQVLATADWLHASDTAPGQKKSQKSRQGISPAAAEFARLWPRLMEQTGPPAARWTEPTQPVAPWDVALLEHPLLQDLALVPADVPDAARRQLGNETRTRGRPRSETLHAVALELAKKTGLCNRLRQALTHTAWVCAASRDPAAPAVASLAHALLEPQKAPVVELLVALLQRAMDSSPPSDPLSSRDFLREDMLGNADLPTGVEVLALDLGACALDVATDVAGVADALDDDRLKDLCILAGQQAAVLLAKPGHEREDLLLTQVGREAILQAAPNLPSRQRRELVEGWQRAWLELLHNACRLSCSQKCLEHLDKPRAAGAFLLDHPRHNRPWPLG